jgi:hypothetical protein
LTHLSPLLMDVLGTGTPLPGNTPSFTKDGT